MKMLLLILSTLFVNQISSQIHSDITLSIELHQEPQSILVVKNNWRTDTESNRELGAALLFAGFTTTALCIYEGNETWKKASNPGWKYDPFISQSTRPYMMAIGIGSSLTGFYFFLR
jgi:hypothetical protein